MSQTPQPPHQPHQPRRPRPTHAPVRFDDRIFQEDLAYASVTGIAVARLSRHRYESKGIPVGELRITEAKGPHAAVLPRCLKVYLPPPDGPFGMVFRLMIDGDGAHLEYLAFGGRRPPSH
jgi:hypothetical protein